jgi:hypothetical protein
MQEYRAYVFGADGHVKDCIEFRALDDQAAFAHARQYVHDQDAEVSILTRVASRIMPTVH